MALPTPSGAERVRETRNDTRVTLSRNGPRVRGVHFGNMDRPTFTWEGLPMACAYNVVDADGHILEPLDLWDRYIDPGFRERRPRFVIDENGKERLSVDGKLLGNPRGIGSLGSVGVRQGLVKA